MVNGGPGRSGWGFLKVKTNLFYMREIKFRVFKKETEIMYYPDCGQENFNHYFQIGAGGFWLYDKDGKLLCTSNWGDTIMQYTGLKDKNGKDIYEGDILREPAKDEWEAENFAAYEIFFHDGDMADNHIGFQLNRMHFYGSVCGGSLLINLLPKWTKRLEIIGNIHDNPELLTPADKAAIK